MARKKQEPPEVVSNITVENAIIGFRNFTVKKASSTELVAEISAYS